MIKIYRKSKKEGFTKKEALVDLTHAETLISKEIVSSIHSYLKEHSIKVDDLISYQKRFFLLGFLEDPVKDWHNYFKSLDGLQINRSKGKLKYSMNCYSIAENIGWILEILNERPAFLSDIATNIDADLKICPYCMKPYRPKREIQFSCGKPLCENAHRNEKKRTDRKNVKRHTSGTQSSS